MKKQIPTKGQNKQKKNQNLFYCFTIFYCKQVWHVNEKKDYFTKIQTTEKTNQVIGNYILSNNLLSENTPKNHKVGSTIFQSEWKATAVDLDRQLFLKKILLMVLWEVDGGEMHWLQLQHHPHSRLTLLFLLLEI